jgi:hypothetical protein
MTAPNVQETPVLTGEKEKFLIVDTDVHPRMNSISQLHPYMTESWHKRIGVKPISTTKDSNTARNVFTIPKR